MSSGLPILLNLSQSVPFPHLQRQSGARTCLRLSKPKVLDVVLVEQHSTCRGSQGANTLVFFFVYHCGIGRDRGTRDGRVVNFVAFRLRLREWVLQAMDDVGKELVDAAPRLLESVIHSVVLLIARALRQEESGNVWKEIGCEHRRQSEFAKLFVGGARWVSLHSVTTNTAVLV
jgi:hypothetical protein